MSTKAEQQKFIIDFVNKIDILPALKKLEKEIIEKNKIIEQENKYGSFWYPEK